MKLLFVLLFMVSAAFGQTSFGKFYVTGDFINGDGEQVLNSGWNCFHAITKIHEDTIVAELLVDGDELFIEFDPSDIGAPFDGKNIWGGKNFFNCNEYQCRLGTEKSDRSYITKFNRFAFGYWVFHTLEAFPTENGNYQIDYTMSETVMGFGGKGKPTSCYLMPVK